MVPVGGKGYRCNTTTGFGTLVLTLCRHSPGICTGLLLDAVGKHLLSSMCGVHIQCMAVLAASLLLSHEYAAPTCYATPLIPAADSNMCLMLMYPVSKDVILPPAEFLVHVNQNATRHAPLPTALSEWRLQYDSCLVHPLFLIGACALAPRVYDGQHSAPTVILMKGD